MKKYSRLPIDFLKKELKSLEKSYEQFKEIYDYFHSEAMGIENKDVEKKIALPKENYKLLKKNNAVILIHVHTCRLVILKSHFNILTQ